MLIKPIEIQVIFMYERVCVCGCGCACGCVYMVVSGIRRAQKRNHYTHENLNENWGSEG